MDEYRISGIVISAIDYKEKDKLITIFSLQLGKVTATLKGVKGANAKLKFAGQKFCFANFILRKQGQYFTVISAEQIDNFYELAQNYDKVVVADSMLEMVNSVLKQDMISEFMFVTTLKALKELAYSDVVENLVLIKYMLLMFSHMGYEISFNECNSCKTKLIDEIYFNYELGSICCKNCKGHFSYELTKKQFSILKIINNCTFEQLSSVKAQSSDLIGVVAVLERNFYYRFNANVKTILNFIVAV